MEKFTDELRRECEKRKWLKPLLWTASIITIIVALIPFIIIYLMQSL